MAEDREREEAEDREAMDALLGMGPAGKERSEAEEGELESKVVERRERDEEEESFEEELMPFLEMGIAEEEEEVERELVKEKEEGVVPKPPEEEEVTEEVPEIEREVFPKPFFNKRLLVAASILFPLLVTAGAISLLALRITISKDHLDKGIVYIEEGRFNEAESEFKEGIKGRLFGRYKEYSRYGLAYLKEKEYRRAEAKFNHILRERPKDIQAHHNLIKLYLAMEDEDRLRQTATHILEKIDPADVEALLVIGRLSMQEEKLDQAYYYLDHALRISPRKIEVLEAIQRVFMAKGEYDKALSVHRYVLSEVPPKERTIDPEILTELGIAYIDRGDLAEELFKTALNYDPHNYEARFRLASVYANRGWLSEAKVELDIVIKDNPGFIPARGLMGEILCRQGRYDEAEEFLKEAVSAQPQDPENHYWMGQIYYAGGKMKETIEAYERAHRLGFKTRDMVYNWGVAHYEEGDYERAIDHWSELLKDDQDNPILNYNLGNAYAQIRNWPEAKGRYEEAIAQYHKRLRAAELTGTSVELEDKLHLELGKVYNNIGVVCEKLKMQDDALRSYIKALEYASWGRGEDRIAYQNLNRVFENRSIKEISRAIHAHLRHRHIES